MALRPASVLAVLLSMAPTGIVVAAETLPEPPPTVAGRAGAVAPPAPPADHATPRLKLSYVRFSMGNVDGGAVPLEALHIDLYPLSRRWIRAGIETEAGRGHATLSGASASIVYGLVGVNAGLQLPGRVTPFLEGRLAGGVLGGHLDGPFTVPGTNTSVSGGSVATWIYARGVDAGVEVYTFGRAYLSLSLGWVRTTWGDADYAAVIANAGASIQFRDVTHDSFLLKLGIGF
jgi:hypothetical protein